MAEAQEIRRFVSRKGRPLHGVLEIAARCPAGHAAVITCSPLQHQRGRFVPFPTLYWLVCPQLCRTLANLERGGVIKQLEAEIAGNATFLAAISNDHDDYIVRRWATLSPEERNYVERESLAEKMRSRGIGGIMNHATVKCLHTHFAHHLACGSTIGRWIATKYPVTPCPAATNAQTDPEPHFQREL